jgi:hypothetical protein
LIRLLVFCEAEGDFRTIAGLVDRVLREEGPVWLKEHLESYPLADVRGWVCDGGGREFFNLHYVDRYACERDVRLPHNRFNGRRGAAGYLMARTAFLVARHEAKKFGPIDAVILVWDADDQGDERREGMDQARKTSLPEERFRIVLGCPDLEREAWVLAGFEPEHNAERDQLEKERRALGFCPCAEAHRLRDKDDQALRSPKRVLAALTSEVLAREERCWTEAPLDRLRERGGGSGLHVFLGELKTAVAPRS